MSKALDMSICRSSVREAGFFLLKPAAMASLKSLSAVVVEWFFLKPCWKSGTGRQSVNSGRRSLSRTLAAGQRRETGRYDLDSQGSLPGFGSGMIVDDFQIAGTWQVAIERLKTSAK